MRRAWLGAALAAAALLAGCARKPAPAPEIVAVKVARADMPRFRAIAAGCGAVSTRIEAVGDATLLTVGKDSPLAARDCFFEQARADYQANHPVRAWIEGLIS